MRPEDAEFLYKLAGAFGLGGLVFAAVAWLMGKFFLGSYLTEKGKNLATKEDVAAITREVERTKAEFVQNLGFLTEKGKNLATKEDVAAITREIESVKSEYTMLAEQFKAKNQLRVAAIDKRLAAHQEAFTWWRKLVKNAYSNEVGQVVLEAQTWWEENCLYLEPEAREAFSLAYSYVHTHKQLVESMSFHGRSDVTNIERSWDKVMSAGDVIMRSISLPPLSHAEVEMVKPKPLSTQ